MKKFLPLLSALLLVLPGAAIYAQNPFITTWEFDRTIPSTIRIVIPTHPDETYNYNVKWRAVSGQNAAGSSNGVTGNFTIFLTPTTATRYVVQVEITGQFPRFWSEGIATANPHSVEGTASPVKLLSVSQWGDVPWTSMERAFYGARDLRVTATDIPDLSRVTSLKEMFRDAESVDASLGNWNMATITDMTGMLSGTGLSMANYDATLAGWAAQNGLQRNVNLGVDGLLYCAGADARQQLIDKSGWSVSGDTPACASMMLFVKTEDGITVVVLAEKSDAVQQLKQKIQDKAGIPAGEQQLFFNGNELDDGRTLEEYAIQNGSSLNLIRETGSVITPGENNILYVDIDVDTGAGGYTGAGDSWANAIPQLADALQWAKANESNWTTGNPLQVWVANGTYKPAGAGRNATFPLIRNVAIYGGFSGNPSETRLDHRNLKANPTILSGDIDGDGTKAGNAYHVVTSAGGNLSSKLDGFIITGGNADGSSNDSRGGGVFAEQGGATLLNISFLANRATGDGGGIFISRVGVVLQNALFAYNEANQGGGLFGQVSFVEIRNATFSRNRSVARGGAIAHGWNGFLTMTNTIIWDNEAQGSSTDATASFFNAAGANTFSHNLVANSGGTGGHMDADPLFINPTAGGPTLGDFRLQTCSPAINKGANAQLPEGLSKDADGNPRTVHAVVDMGAFEYQGPFPAGGLAFHNDQSTQNINGPTDFYGNDETCRLIARVAPTGAAPVSGSVTARVGIDPEVAFHNGSPYVQRHYQVNAQTGGSAKITLYFTQEEFDSFNAELSEGRLPTGPADEANKSNLRVYQYHGAGGSKPADYQGAALTVIDPAEEAMQWNAVRQRWEISFEVAGFSGFFIGSAASPLPVKLVSFSGAYDGENGVGLQWKVTEQQDIEAYRIEYSTDGAVFREAGAVAATRTAETGYTFRHTSPVGKSLVYYRLRIVEADGAHSYSRIIGVRIPDRPLAVVYPVPAAYGFWVEGQGLAGTAGRLVTLQGIVVKTWDFVSDKQYVELSALPPGLYFVRLHDGTALKVVRK